MAVDPSDVDCAGCKPWRISWSSAGTVSTHSVKGYANAVRWAKRNVPTNHAYTIEPDTGARGCC